MTDSSKKQIPPEREPLSRAIFQLRVYRKILFYNDHQFVELLGSPSAINDKFRAGCPF
jgi:hypothetical protein